MWPGICDYTHVKKLIWRRQRNVYQHKANVVIGINIQFGQVIDTRRPDNVIHNGYTKVKG